MRTAVVVGAGVGGLAAAGALARAGWAVTLLERQERLRAAPATLLLWPEGRAALRALGVDGGLAQVATPVVSAGVRRPDGSFLVRPRPGAERALLLHEQDLHDALMAGLGGRVDVHTGVDAGPLPVTGSRPAVGDGTRTFAADLLVAADGAGSPLRSRLVPEAILGSAGCAAWRGVLPWYRMPVLPEDTPPVGEFLGAGHRFSYARVRAGAASGGLAWAATVPGAPRPEPPAQQVTLLRRWFAGWSAPVEAILAATEPVDLFSVPVPRLWPMPRTFAVPVGDGGVLLLGDAAHAMPHHLARGACLALEDAAELGRLVAGAAPDGPLGAVLRGYGRRRRARALTLARRSARVGAVLATRGRLAVRARNAALGSLPSGLVRRAADHTGKDLA